MRTNAISNYNGMVVSFEQRFTRWGSGLFQVNYTYGHALDEVSNGGLSYFTTGSSILPARCQQSSRELRGGGVRRAPFRHRKFRLGSSVKETLRGHGPDSLVNGWQISGTILARTGNPLHGDSTLQSRRI